MSDQQPPESGPPSTPPPAGPPETPPPAVPPTEPVPAAGGGGRNRLVLIGAVVVVVVIVVAGLATFLLNRGGPASTVQSYVDDVIAGDCHLSTYVANDQLGVKSESKRKAAVAKFDKQNCKGTTAKQRAKQTTGCKVALGKTTTTGNKAKVAYTVKSCKASSNDEKGTFELVKESGDWRISGTS